MWDLSRPGLEPVSPALAGGFLTTGPPGKSWLLFFNLTSLSHLILLLPVAKHEDLTFAVNVP